MTTLTTDEAAVDIVARLRQTNPYVNDPVTLEPRLINPDGPAAADEIETLRAQLTAATRRAEQAERVLAEAVQAHENVVNPLEMLRQEAEVDGNKLSGAAYEIANNLHFVKQISRKFLTTIRSAASGEQG